MKNSKKEGNFIIKNGVLPFLKYITPEKLSNWCDAHRIIADGASSESGRWRTDRTPYMRDIMDAVTDPDVHEVLLCTSVQTGKTELLLNTICYYMLHEPSSIMLVEPDRALVTDIGVDRIDSMINATPELQKIFGINGTSEKSTKKANMQKNVKRFNGGFLFLASACAKTALKSRPIRVVLCDEIDVYEARPDGHPVDMAINRTTTFSDYKVILVSTPTTVQSSEIWRRFQNANVYEYTIPCPECGECNIWRWEMVKWDVINGEADPETARVVCPSCGHVFKGSGVCSSELLSTGSWELKKCNSDNNKKKAFRLPGLYSPFKTLSSMVSEFLDATRTKDIDRLRTFIQERLAEPWDDRPAPWKSSNQKNILTRFEENPDHSLIRFITAGVDIQHDRIECSLWGFTTESESWAIEHVIFVGDTLKRDVWARLREYLLSEHELLDGRKGKIIATCVDSADGSSFTVDGERGEKRTFSRTQIVYRFCAPLEKKHIVAIKGKYGDNIPLISAPNRSNTERAPLYRIAVNRFKNIIMDRLQITEVGAGYIHLPKDWEGERYSQLVSECCETVIEHGKVKTVWKKLQERNEVLDCAVYALAAYEMFCGSTKKRR
jgi:phage terminase large subunit GpA-like protein